ncbi:integrase, partial [Streptomyces sp. A73]|nr:integrase [Streptomyces sp. A73]
MLTKAYTGMRLGEMFGLRREFCHPYWPASDPDAERRGERVARYGGDDPMPAIRVQWQHKYRKDPANLDARGVPVFAPPKYG